MVVEQRAAVSEERGDRRPSVSRPPQPALEGDYPAGRAVSPVGPPARPWHILYFLPDPQGHCALRPTLANGSSALETVVPLTSTSPCSVGAE